MPDIINLRQQRKRKNLAQKEQAAKENRAAHGLTKDTRVKRAHEKNKLAKTIEGARLETDPQ